MKTLLEEVQEELAKVDLSEVTGEEFDPAQIGDEFLFKIESEHHLRLVGLRQKLVRDLLKLKRDRLANKVSGLADTITAADIERVPEAVQGFLDRTSSSDDEDVLKNKIKLMETLLWAELEHASPKMRQTKGSRKICRGFRVFKFRDGLLPGLGDVLRELGELPGLLRDKLNKND